MHVRGLSRFASSSALGLALVLVPAAVRAGNTAPAIAAFDKAFSAIRDYTCTITIREVKGSQTQNRVYQYSFMKPHFAKTLIVSGDGAGSGGVWAGGDEVSGHQGGILSGIHLKVGLHDSRAVDLLGFTIPDGLLQNIVHKYATIPGTLTQTPGGKLGGVPTDRLDLKVADPSKYLGFTEEILYLSKVTHFPVREIIYSGNQIVLDQSVSDLKLNAGLTQSDFPF
jgi:outer membrane lipoprotein-sorting protein